MAVFVQPIQVDVPSIGTVELRGMSIGAIADIESLLAQDLDARTFAVHVTSALLIEPKLSLRTISTWPDDTLQYVVTQWTLNPKSLNLTLPDDSTCFTVFKEAVASYISNYAINSPIAGYIEEQRRAIEERMALLTGTVSRLALFTAQAAAAQHLKQFDWTPQRIWSTVGSGVDMQEIFHTVTGRIDLSPLFSEITALTKVDVTPILPRMLESVGELGSSRHP